MVILPLRRPVVSVTGAGRLAALAVPEPEFWCNEPRGDLAGRCGVLEVRVHLKVRLRLTAEDVHLVLIEALVAAKLQLLLAVLEIDVVDRVSDVLAPVAHLVLLEGGAPALREAQLGAERFASARRPEREQFHAHFLTPGAQDAVRW